MENYTQVGIEVHTKNRLDMFKATKRDEILEHFKRKKRFITNTLAIDYLLDQEKMKKHEQIVKYRSTKVRK
jgi:hypothetical protein